jgi:thiol-disulfide isomerase/thioredoxin
MKILSTIFLFFLFKLTIIFGQLPDNSVAPDFEVTDIQGNTHHLYEYLNQGKTVVLNFSTTWCPPCWDYFQSNVMNNLYDTYGPNGSNEIIALFIECDPATTLDDLTGIGLSTLGDWTLDQNYPIINDNQHPMDPYKTIVGTLYDINFIPTIYIIGPNRKLLNDDWQDGFLNHHGLHGLIDNFDIASFDKDVAAFNYIGHSNHCQGNLTPQIIIQNLGLGGNLQNATIKTMHNGQILQTNTWSGNLGLYETDLVSLSDLYNMTAECTLTFEVSTENDQNEANGFLDKTIAPIENIAQPDLILRIETDDYPEDISWEIKDYSHNTIAHGSNYANTYLIEENITLNDLQNCYYFHINDVYGDGLGTGKIQLLNASDESIVFEILGNSYKTAQITHFTPETQMFDVVEENEKANILLYPNPANEFVLIDLSGEKNVTVPFKIVNVLGNTVEEMEVLSGGLVKINTEQYNTGVYFLMLDTNKVFEFTILK